MAIPQSVLAAGWVPFVVVLVLTLLFSFFYIRYFQSKYDSEVCSSITSMFGITVALLTILLVPVDIFLVSFMKTSDGHFKSWAESNETRLTMENGVLYAYYALYSCVILFVFIILPFTYFFYEEGDEDTQTKSRLCTAFKYTLVLVFVAAVLLIVGAFAPLKTPPTSNSTEWDRIKYLFEEMGNNNGEDSISFTISSLTLVGMLMLVIYTGYGMSAWPMDLVKGRRSATKERVEVVERHAGTMAEIERIRSKYRDGRRISARDQQKLDDLEEQERYQTRRRHHLETAERSCVTRCLLFLRPFQIFFGILFFLMTFLVFITLLLTDIDKVLHSNGWRMGYSLEKTTLPNLIDITLVFAQKVFPVDYILIAGLIIYFFFCSMGGVQHIGIWCCWIRMYKIRPRRTKPQGLLFMCLMLMFIVLGLNIVIYQITPQYSTFGSQHYIKMVNHTEGNITTQTSEVLQCTRDAPPDECVMTRMSMLLTRFFYKVWFFGACYFYASWAFLAVMLLGFIVSLVRKRRSSVEGCVDIDDLDDSDDELLAP